jgi:hypothetical protein
MSLEGVDTSWLIPWANRFLGHVEPGENPWSQYRSFSKREMPR